MLIGIVGKPNCGKSTFFKALTLADITIANYPFATIKPNHGYGHVRIPCAETFFQVKCNPREGFCIKGNRFVPVEVIDVAGLVPGASEGKGMGNQFLDDLNQADALIHVIDVSGSTNEKGEPVGQNAYDPANDVEFLEKELDQWYLRILDKGWERFARTIQQEHSDIAKALAKQLSGLRVDEDLVKEAIRDLALDPQKPAAWTDAQRLGLASAFRKATKPIVIAANKIDVPGASDNFTRLVEQFPEYRIVACSAESELALKEAAKHGLLDYIPGEKDITVKGALNEKQEKAINFIKDQVLEKFNTTGVQDVMNAVVFQVLQYIAVFPGGLNKLEDQHGNVLPDCFLLPKESTALQFAYRIHSDLGDKFIRAIDVKTKMTVGKEHQLKHLDVIEIVTAK